MGCIPLSRLPIESAQIKERNRSVDKPRGKVHSIGRCLEYPPERYCDEGFRELVMLPQDGGAKDMDG